MYNESVESVQSQHMPQWKYYTICKCDSCTTSSVTHPVQSKKQNSKTVLGNYCFEFKYKNAISCSQVKAHRQTTIFSISKSNVRTHSEL